MSLHPESLTVSRHASVAGASGPSRAVASPLLRQQSQRLQRVVRLGLLLLVLGWLLSDATVAHAIPPFARRYGMSCSTCHVGGPNKLTPLGEAFRDNGYRIPGEDESFLRDPPIPMGAESRKSLFPNTVWPGELPAGLPIGATAQFSGRVEIPGETGTGTSTAQISAAASLLFGGSLGKHITMMGTVFVGSNGANLGQVFIVGRSLMQRWLGEGALNVKVGRMRLDLFPLQPALQRSVLQAYSYDTAIGKDGFSLGQGADAIELFGLVKGRLKWVLGAANGRKPTDDLSSRRDVFARLQLKLGGTRLDYLNASLADDAPTVLIGASTYIGTGVTTPAAPASRFTNDFYRLMADLRVRAHNLDLIGQVTLGQDSDPDGNGTQVRSLSWSAHLDYPIFPWLQPLVRYEESYSDSDSRPSRRRLVMGMQFFIRTNVRLRFEGAAGLTSNESHQFIGDLFYAL